MYLHIEKSIRDKIEELRTNNEKIILNLNDGAGKFSDNKASCALDLYFDILLVNPNEDLHEYGEMLSSDIGPIFMKPYSSVYLEQENTLKKGSLGVNVLAGEKSGIICHDVKIKK
ncbi:iron-sulfur cluster biosynthesis family protein [Listeria fleischmannii]|jgi:uncharacterized protein YqkB|uniref:Core domain-containing protein n=2 Tax=Listeria fleischmannii TaxID=1069827 RepID=W7DR62_9LIST|nr:iron-sulfur cluster biosynthesis family protein [Listeria fleischmannii]EIA21634.1 hypothetical protein KKC_00160 [Listeria fleischmannii subsp. coloradonensis]EUJ52558.1 hypothetical protein MCOL2_13237 [Listeria fleischmannii FSL S10-1203]MBC1397812.1 iron-sulfur cluster biosynthesis family protein [Listeria fleischmannii]MBC1417537.1 iron-sulfur cluster biosynthesis family protein [Listeria fleischmannii]MBC1427423.1 iron-sulfur cluster biosynthesis family protein [Listeria fleischmannii